MNIQKLLESRFEEDALETTNEASEEFDDYPDAAFPGEDIGWILFRREELAKEKLEEDKKLCRL